MCGVTKRLAIGIVLLTSAAHFAVGQADLGSLSGSITDPSGSAVAGAKITATSAGAGAERTALSGSGTLEFATGGSLGNRTLVDINTHNFAPRLGFAYSPDENTVVRGGYGIFYLTFERFGSEDELALNPPFLVQTQGAIPSTSNTPLLNLQTGFPASWLNPADINYQLTQVRTVNPYDPTPYVQQWSFGIQRKPPVQLLLDVNYIGTKSTHLPVLSDLNQYINGVTPYPNFGELEY